MLAMAPVGDIGPLKNHKIEDTVLERECDQRCHGMQTKLASHSCSVLLDGLFAYAQVGSNLPAGAALGTVRMRRSDTPDPF